MKQKSISILLFLFSLLFYSNSLRANNYWLVSGITSPSLHSIPMEDLDTCKKAGEKITKDIYKPVWQFDSKWTCVFSGNN